VNNWSAFGKRHRPLARPRASYAQQRPPASAPWSMRGFPRAARSRTIAARVQLPEGPGCLAKQLTAVRRRTVHRLGPRRHELTYSLLRRYACSKKVSELDRHETRKQNIIRAMKSEKGLAYGHMVLCLIYTVGSWHCSIYVLPHTNTSPLLRPPARARLSAASPAGHGYVLHKLTSSGAAPRGSVPASAICRAKRREMRYNIYCFSQRRSQGYSKQDVWARGEGV